jgi:hypothetical protein
MFGSKKKEKKEDKKEEKLEELPKIEKEKTEIQDAKIQSKDTQKMLEWVLKEYTNTYAGIFTSQDIENIDTDATTLNLLVAIYSEMRLIRELLSKAD